MSNEAGRCLGRVAAGRRSSSSSNPQASIGPRRRTTMMSSRIFSPLMLGAAISMSALGAYAAETATDAKVKPAADKQEPASASTEKPSLKAMLVEPEKKAKEKAATVKVTVTG